MLTNKPRGTSDTDLSENFQNHFSCSSIKKCVIIFSSNRCFYFSRNFFILRKYMTVHVKTVRLKNKSTRFFKSRHTNIEHQNNCSVCSYSVLKSFKDNNYPSNFFLSLCKCFCKEKLKKKICNAQIYGSLIINQRFILQNSTW